MGTPTGSLTLDAANAASLGKALTRAESDGPVAAAIDHGGTHPRFGLFDCTGRSLLRGPDGAELPAGVGLDLPTYDRLPKACASPGDLPEYTVELLADWLKPLFRRLKVDYLGYAMAGPVTEDGVQVNTPNIWGTEATNVPWRAMLEDRLNLRGRVVHGNDMWAAANDIIARGRLGQVNLDVDNFIVITVSSGIGSKVVRHGEVDLGVDGLAGEIGHLPLLWPEEVIPGRRCGCGGLYCLEAGSSGNSNAHRVKDQVERLAPLTAASSSRALIEAVTAISLAPGEDLDDRVMRLNQATIGAAQEGDPLALQLLGSTLRPIARAVACVESQLNIRNFYFVGGFALHTGALFLDLLRDAIVALGGISGRRQADIRRIGALYPVETHDWGLRGVALAAHRKLADCLRR